MMLADDTAIKQRTLRTPIWQAASPQQRCIAACLTCTLQNEQRRLLGDAKGQHHACLPAPGNAAQLQTSCNLPESQKSASTHCRESLRRLEKKAFYSILKLF